MIIGFCLDASLWSLTEPPYRLPKSVVRVTIALLCSLWISPSSAVADGGDFHLDFVGSAPRTYNHNVGGGAYNDRTVGIDKDIIESKEGGEYKCGDIITYFTQVVVDGAPSDPVQTIELDYEFLADSTGQSGIGVIDIVDASINYGQVENGDNYDSVAGGGGKGVLGLDGGMSDDRQNATAGPGGVPADTGAGGSTATLTAESLTGPIFTSGTVLKGTVRVNDLEAGEHVIVRVDVFLGCEVDHHPTGVLQGALAGQRVVAPTPDTIPGGVQTIPFSQVGEVEGVGEPLLNIEKTVTTQAGTCGVDDVESLTVPLGADVKYCYQITNGGTAPLFDLIVTDDNGTPGNLADDFTVTLVLPDLDGQGDAGDLAGQSSLPGIPQTFVTGEFLVTVLGNRVNTATATGNNGLMGGNFAVLTDNDTATVNAGAPPAVPILQVDKTVAAAAGSCPGSPSLTVPPGTTVKYCYSVTNVGGAPAHNVTVTDDNATTGNPADDFLVTLTGLTDEDGDTNADDLAAGAAATGEKLTLLNTAGTFVNTATPSSSDPDLSVVVDSATVVVASVPPAGPFCAKGPIKLILSPAGPYPGNLGLDFLVEVELGDSAQAAINAAGDLNGDGFIIIGVRRNDTTKAGGETTESIVINGVYSQPFALLSCSVTLLDDNTGDGNPTARISAGASAPSIFVMDLHAARSEVEGWRVEGDGRSLQNIRAVDNSGDGIRIVGNNNTFQNGVDIAANIGTGIFVQGNGNIVANSRVRYNLGPGIQIVGNNNIVVKSRVGDRGKGNGGDGIHVFGAGNSILNNTIVDNTGDGIDVIGGTSANPNVIRKNRVGARRQGNGGNGILVVGDEGNGTLDPVEIDENKVSNNGLDGIKILGNGHELKKNTSGTGNTKDDSGGCDFNVAEGNFNGKGNKAGNFRIPGRDGDPFPTGCIIGSLTGGSGVSGSGGGSHGENLPPQAVVREEFDRSASPCCALTLNGSRSEDRDGTIVEYEFNLVDKATGETVAGFPIAQATPTVALTIDSGEYVATLQVTDAEGASSRIAERRFTAR